MHTHLCICLKQKSSEMQTRMLHNSSALAAHRTNVDGVWIRSNQPRPLPKGSVFKLGGSTREFKVRDLALKRLFQDKCFALCPFQAAVPGYLLIAVL